MGVKKSKGLSDDAFDAMTAVIIIVVIVIAVVFWLQGMPS